MPSELSADATDDALRPLDGLRVLDFTNLPPGAGCTALLADLGAEVFRVEPLALVGKPSLVFGQVALGRGKRSAALDLRHAGANAVLARLVATADIVVENAKPGLMEARGFGYRQAREANHGVIWCAITGFGQTGPYADHAGHDVSYLAHSGLLAAISDDRDLVPGQGLALPAAAQTAVIAIQAALIQRGRTGQGAFLDISLSEAAGWFLTCGINALAREPLVLAASPDRRTYKCSDGRFVTIACAEPRTWAALCEGLGVPELGERLRDTAGAVEITGILSDRFLTQSAAEWARRLAPAGAAVTVLNRGAEVVADAHVQARGAVVRVGETYVPANPVRIEAPDGRRTGTRASVSPLVGADTDALLADAGFAAEEIETLRSAKLI